MAAHGDEALHGSDRPDASRRRREAAAAGHTGDVTVARGLLSDEEPGVRAAAFAALVRIGAAGLRELEGALFDPSPIVRRRALELSFRCALDSDAVSVLVASRLSDETPEVVEAACFALGELASPAAATRLGEVATHHPDPLCRESAVAAIGAIGDPSGLGVVLSALGDRPTVRRRAVLALAAFEGDEVEAALVACIEDRDWQVRQAAEDLLGSRTGPPPASSRRRAP